VVVLCRRTMADDLLQVVILWCLWGVNAKVGVVKGRHLEDVERKWRGGRDWVGFCCRRERAKEKFDWMNRLPLWGLQAYISGMKSMEQH